MEEREAALERYVLEHTDEEGNYLHRLYRFTHLRTVHGRMVSGHMQGRLLRMLVLMARPHRILEVGTFSGYSALCMAEGLSELAEESNEKEDYRLFTFEINDEMEPLTRPWLEGSPWARFIDFHIGDACREAPSMGLQFDMMFIDGDKRRYVETFEQLFPLLSPGGWILIDNTLWDGHVVEEAYNHDAQTIGIRRLNDYLMGRNDIERVLLPLRDGLTVVRKKKS